MSTGEQIGKRVVNQNSKRLATGLSFLAFFMAFTATAVLMVGDEFGKVNLIYLLLLFVLLPLFSLGLTLYCAVFNTPFNVTNLLLNFPFWPSAWLDSLSVLKRSQLQRPWLFYQGQKLALIFSVASLLAFFSLLLVSDVTFVWRSTLLSAEQLYPLLKMIAQPWFFIEAGQPLMLQVESSQDSRLILNTDLAITGVWWRFIFLSQCFYVIFPRFLLLVWGYRNFKKASAAHRADDQDKDIIAHGISPVSEVVQLQEICCDTLNVADSIVLNWSILPAQLKTRLFSQFGEPLQLYNIGALAADNEVQAALQDSRKKLILVAAWEPPMGELEDIMRETSGTLLVLDWNEEGFKAVESQHLDEWRRFCFQLKNWQFQQLEGLQ